MKRSIALAAVLSFGFAQLFWPELLRSAEQPDAASAIRSTTAPSVVEGTVTFRGEIPKSSVADNAGKHQDLLRVERASGGLEGVVVWLAIAERAPYTNATPAVMDQRDHEFVPRVLAVRAGQPVKFINSDAANHNVRTTSRQSTNEFNISTGVDGSYTHRFAANAENRPVRLDCDIHPWMRGWIYVFENNYFAVTDEHGRFRIPGVPPGQYKLEVRQPGIRYSGQRAVVVPSAGRVSVRIEISAEAKPKD